MRAVLIPVLLTAFACKTAEPSRPEPHRAQAVFPRGVSLWKQPRAVVWVGGDVLLSGAMRRWVRREGDSAGGLARVLEPAAAVWRKDGAGAFVLVNLESPVAREVRNENDAFRRSKRGNARVPAPLNAPPWLLDALRRAGVDAVMLANNHALDQGREGLDETIDAAHAAGLVVTGAGRAPHVGWPVLVGDADASVALLTYFEKDHPEPALAAGEAGLSVLGPRALDDVRAAASEAAVIVVVIHVVAELLETPKPRWRDWAQRLAEAGADAVLFHGTHVPGPVETVRVGGREAVVAYGLGNALSDMGARASPEQDRQRDEDKWSVAATRAGLFARIEARAGRADVRFLVVWAGHDRYLVHNRVVDRREIAFELHPLAPCGRAAALPGWPEPYRAEMQIWLGERRDEVLRASGLEQKDCGLLLSPPPFRGML